MNTRIVFVLMLVLVTACGKPARWRGEMKLECDCLQDQAKQEEVLRVLKKRLKILGTAENEITVDGNRIHVRSGRVQNPGTVLYNIADKPVLEFWKTYDAMDALSWLLQADEAMRYLQGAPDSVMVSGPDSLTYGMQREQPILRLLQLSMSMDEYGRMQEVKGAEIGYALVKDTSQISRMLVMGLSRDMETRNSIWSWKALPDDKDRFALLVLRRDETTGGPVMDGRHYKSAARPEKVMGNYRIRLQLNEEGDKIMERLSREEQDHALAITFDGRVISAPILAGPITGGKVEITGDSDSVYRIYYALRLPDYPCALRLVEQHFEERK